MSITILRTNFSLESPCINIEVSHPSSDRNDYIRKEWEIDIIGYRKSRFVFCTASNISVSNNHPLLWEFNDTQCELYFSNKCKSIAELFADLYKVHLSLFNSYLPFETFLNNIGISIFGLLNANSGLFAKGPKILLLKYENCLKEHGLKTSIISERLPSYWNGNQLISENLNAKVLFIDDSYIITDKFIFK